MNALYREIAEALRPVIEEVVTAAFEAQKSKPSPYMTAQEAAEHFNVTDATVRRWVREGKIESRRQGGKILIPRQTGR